MSDTISNRNAADAVMDRPRRVALIVASLGFLFNGAIAIVYGVTGGFDLFWLFNFTVQSSAILAICLASYRDWHFRGVLNAAIGVIYLHLWGSTIYEAWIQTASVVGFIVLLFIPFYLVLVSGYRVLLAYAVMQGALVYLFSSQFLAEGFGLNPNAVDFTLIASVLSILSALTLVVLAVVSYSRRTLDGRLVDLVKTTERLADQDDLTSLVNRRAFMTRVKSAWESKEQFAVAFIDLDRFKPLNDEYGHAAGDQILRAIALRLSRHPNVTIASRFGGDEFAILVRQSDDAGELSNILADLHRQVTDDIELAEATVAVGASFGYALAIQDGATVGELLHAADTAMRRCKSQGGGVAKFDPKSDSVTLSSSAMEELFRKALKTRKIRPALQPVIDAKTRKVIGHELLARWVDSDFPRDPSPLEFVPIAEKLGLLNDLLWQTLNMAIPVVKQGDGFLAVNVSPSQLLSRNFLTRLQKISTQHQFDLSRLEIEITETVSFRNLAKNIEILEAARRLGCTIALDDFGSGYSSLSLLEELPINKVKLDRSLQLTGNKRGVLQATVQLAKTLGFQCCVEGVESKQAAQFATDQGCDQMQGYHFGAPELVPHTHNRELDRKAAT